MLAAVMHRPGDARFEDVADPKSLKSTDAIIRLAATCICGSDLWPYRGAQSITEPMHRGHEYRGIVVGVGSAVTR
ncbi:alcohol dehydrogenase catalytic domain-containing protein [Paracoccus sp. PXZ]